MQISNSMNELTNGLGQPISFALPDWTPPPIHRENAWKAASDCFNSIRNRGLIFNEEDSIWNG